MCVVVAHIFLRVEAIRKIFLQPQAGKWKLFKTFLKMIHQVGAGIGFGVHYTNLP